MNVYDVVTAIYRSSYNNQNAIAIVCKNNVILGLKSGQFVSFAFSDERLTSVYDYQVNGLYVDQNGHIAVEI